MYGPPEHVAQTIHLKVNIVIADCLSADLKKYVGQSKTHSQIHGLAVGQQRKEEILTILYTNRLMQQSYGSCNEPGGSNGAHAYKKSSDLKSPQRAVSYIYRR